MSARIRNGDRVLVEATVLQVFDADDESAAQIAVQLPAINATIPGVGFVPLTSIVAASETPIDADWLFETGCVSRSQCEALAERIRQVRMPAAQSAVPECAIVDADTYSWCYTHNRCDGVRKSDGPSNACILGRHEPRVAVERKTLQTGEKVVRNFSDLREGLEFLCTDRIRSRRDFADNVMGGGERGNAWFSAASPTVEVDDLRLLLSDGVVEVNEPAVVLMAKVRKTMEAES